MKSKMPIVLILGLAVIVALFLYLRGGEDTTDSQETEVAAEGEDDGMEKLLDSVREGGTAEIGQAITLSDEAAAMIADAESTIVMMLSTGGPVIIETFPESAPRHVARFKELARQGFYDGIVFHRVIEGFMAQTGDPTGTGSGGSGVNIAAEFNDISHERGVVSTARAADPDSADSQFFIMYEPAPRLDHNYTAWGRVISGMEFVDAVARGPQENNGIVPTAERDRILSMRVAADILGTDGDELETVSEGDGNQ